MGSKRKKDKEEKNVITNEEDFLADLTADINKEFDDAGTMLLEGSAVGDVNHWVSSGHPIIDSDVLGKGWPFGRVVEIFGPESNGKTTVALHAIAETQKLGGITIFLDSEHALSKERAKALGVDLKRLIYAQPGTMEDIFDYVEKIVEKIKARDPERLVTIVWDSVASSPTRSEVEGDYGDHNVGIHGRIMSQGFRKITKLINTSNTLFICINQTRDKIGVMFGDKTSTPGGKALKFYASIRLDVRKIGMLKEGDKVVGIKCKAIAKKNKVAPPFGETEFHILFANDVAGIDQYNSILEESQKAGLLGDTKGYMHYKDKNYRKKELVKYFRENPEDWKAMVDTYMSVK